MHGLTLTDANHTAMTRDGREAVRLGVLTLALLAGGCTTTKVPVTAALTVAEIIARQQDVSGKRVVITGKLSQCQPLSCGLFGRDDEGRQLYLSIGRNPVFDAAAPHFSGRQVGIEATVNLDCMPHTDPDIIVACSDRPATLADPVLLWPL